MSIKENHFKHKGIWGGGDKLEERMSSLGGIQAQLYGHAGKTSYSKSVWSLSSARDVKTKALFFMPSTQAESGELAKMRPEGLRLKTASMRATAKGEELPLQM